MKRLVKWLWWRGVTLKDLVGAGLALGIITGVTGFVLYGLMTAWLG
jgi:hypothetical protein